MSGLLIASLQSFETQIGIALYLGAYVLLSSCENHMMALHLCPCKGNTFLHIGRSAWPTPIWRHVQAVYAEYRYIHVAWLLKSLRDAAKRLFWLRSFSCCLKEFDWG